MSSGAIGVVPIRPSPQKLSGACVVLTTSPVQVTTATIKPQQQPRRPIQLARDNRRRPGYQSYIPPPQPTNVLRRNARERNRVKQVNHGFAALRNHIPSVAKNKKLSKVDTLRRAVEYIQSLQRMLDESDAVSAAESSPQPSPALPQASPALPQASPALPQTTTPVSSCSGDSGYSEPTSTAQHQYLIPSPSSVGPLTPHTPTSLHQLHPAHLSPPCSDASASPAPSFASDQPSYPVSDFDTSGVFVPDHISGYGPEPEISPEDEELLDAIAWWQSSQ